MRKHKFVLPSLLPLLLALFVSASAPQGRAQKLVRHRLMPVPMSVTFEPGRLPVNASFSVAVKGSRTSGCKAA